MRRLWRNVRYVVLVYAPIPTWPRWLEDWWLQQIFNLRFEIECEEIKSDRTQEAA